jgi:dihydrofolate synthase/folylpolyglutamate synthase
VGLGGRLDATNVIEPELSVITPIDYDHEAFLGKSIPAIATEKAGIIKPSTPVLFAPQRPEADAVLRARAVEVGAPVSFTSDWQISELTLEPGGSRFSALRGATRLTVRCPLAGEHQVTNALTAAAALDLLGLPPPPIESGLADVQWSGRLERVATNPEIILDGAHNPAGARVLAAYIRRFYRDRRVWLIYGAMRDKAVAEVASILFEEAGEVILTAPDQSRAVRPEAIREMLDEPDLKTAPSLKDAIAMAKAGATPNDVIFITGSLFLIGEAKRLFSGPHVQ